MSFSSINVLLHPYALNFYILIIIIQTSSLYDISAITTKIGSDCGPILFKTLKKKVGNVMIS